MTDDLKKMYKTIVDEHFPPRMEIAFIDENGRQYYVRYASRRQQNQR